MIFHITVGLKLVDIIYQYDATQEVKVQASHTFLKEHGSLNYRKQS